MAQRLARFPLGGDCLDHILLHGFEGGSQSSSAIRQRKKMTQATIENIYQGLIDRGSWVRWIVENAPKSLASIVVDLQRYGMVRSDEDLGKLIAFNDRRRKLPRAALLPDWQKIRHDLPVAMIFDEARRHLNGLKPADLE